MPKLWTRTIEGHREEVREAILDAAGTLAQSQGLTAVNMSAIATYAGIGRATLYKYFPDVEAILLAWHERQVDRHLQLLSDIHHGSGTPLARLQGVLETYAQIAHEHHGMDWSAALHRGAHVAHAEHRLVEFIRELIEQGGQAGQLRSDAPPIELARYCLHALGAAGGLSSKAAIRRLVQMTLAGLAKPD